MQYGLEVNVINGEKPMEELVGRIVAATGIEEDLAQKAIGIILQLVKSEGPADKVAELFAALPGAAEIADQYSDSGGGGLMGAFGGGAMAALGKLQSAGMGMGQIQSAGKEVIGYAKENAGEELVSDVIGSISGLGGFV